MGVIINNIDGTFSLLEDVHCLSLDDERNFLYYYNRDDNKLHWADLYIIDDKYYMIKDSSISDINEFRRLLSRNITKSKSLSGEIREVSYGFVKGENFSEKIELRSLPESNNIFPDLPDIFQDEKEIKYDNYWPVIAIYEEKNDELLLKLYSYQGNKENNEQFFGEDYGRYKYYYDVKYVGLVKLLNKDIDDLLLEMLWLDKDLEFLKFDNPSNENVCFVIDDILLNYSTISHRCEDKRIVVRVFIADVYISNNNGNECYKHYSNDSRASFVGLKRTVIHRNLYEINRDYNENYGRSR